ncbi:MAG: hypothetical protein KGH78_01925 [Candidatus Micrarchaeota archaeon]|nr:hypothetical protein [Candidatus Micrarchaeota archaeon]MDE1846541.1 hypothetical protein [Candidatus Micrarchaeota archaeon]
MPRYYKVHDSKETIYVTVDDSGAVIIKDKAGNKIFLSRYQAKLMKFGIENLIKDLFKDTDSSDVVVEEMKSEKG